MIGIGLASEWSEFWARCINYTTWFGPSERHIRLYAVYFGARRNSMEIIGVILLQGLFKEIWTERSFENTYEKCTPDCERVSM